MTRDEKELLFKDLSARLPYHVRCKVWLNKYGTTEEGPLDLEHNYGDVLQDAFFYHDRIKDIKPYLRPMSSMTDEEQFQLGRLLGAASYNLLKGEYSSLKELLEYVYKNHIDLFDLIPKGLALEAPEGIYSIKTE